MGAAQWSNPSLTAFQIASSRRRGGGGSGGPGGDLSTGFLIAVMAVIMLPLLIVGGVHMSQEASETKSRKEMIEQQKTYVPERQGHVWKCYDWQGKEYWFDPRRAHQWEKRPDGRTVVLLDTFTKKRAHKSAPLKDVRDSVTLNLPSFEILDHLIRKNKLP